MMTPDNRSYVKRLITLIICMFAGGLIPYYVFKDIYPKYLTLIVVVGELVGVFVFVLIFRKAGSNQEIK